MNYSKKYDGYCTVEYVMIHIQDTHTTFIKIQSGCHPLYIFKNSEKYHTVASDDLNAHKLNLKYGWRNTQLLPDGYYMHHDVSIVVHMMQTEAGV